MRSRSLRPLKAILYAAFIGLLLASYVTPLQEILEGNRRVAQLNSDLEDLKKNNTARERTVEELQTPSGVERVARERYGMIKSGETVYIVPKEEEQQR